MDIMYLDNLLLIMSTSGSVAFLVYLAAKQIWKDKLTPAHRYWLLHLVLGFFLLPIPLLANDIRDFIRELFRDNTLFTEPTNNGVVTIDNLYKSIYITDGKLSLPEINRVLLTAVIIWIVLFCVYVLYYVYHSHKEKQFLDEYPQEDRDVCIQLDDRYRSLIQNRHVRIRIAPKYHPSFTCGTWRPTVILAEAEREEHQKYILIHELIHIKHFDALFLGCSFTALALHFFNPLAYLFFREVKLCIELHCDEKTLQSLADNERKAYGHLIIENAQKPRCSNYVTPFTNDNYRIIRQRVAMIKTNTRKRCFSFLLSAVVLIPAAMIPALAYTVPSVYFNDPYSYTPDVDWAYYMNGEIENVLLEEYETYFSESDALFIDENDAVSLITSDDTTTPYSCNHTYTSGAYAVHTKNSSGDCSIQTYSCKKCTKCSNIISKDFFSSITYTECPH